MKPYCFVRSLSAAPLKWFVNFFNTYIYFITLKRLGDSRLLNSTFIHAIVLFLSIVVVQIKVSEQRQTIFRNEAILLYFIVFASTSVPPMLRILNLLVFILSL